MGNHSSSCSSAAGPESPKRQQHPGQFQPRKPSEGTRAVLVAQRRLTVAKLLSDRLGDDAYWLEGEILEQIIQLIPLAGLTISVGQHGAEYSTIAQGIDAASPGDTIAIGPGLYREPIVLQPSPSSVTVRGTGARPSDVVVEWGDDLAESLGVRAVQVAHEVVEVSVAGALLERARHELKQGAAQRNSLHFRLSPLFFKCRVSV